MHGMDKGTLSTCPEVLLCSWLSVSQTRGGAMAQPKRGSWLLHGLPDLPDDGAKIPMGVRLAHHMRTRHFFASLAILLVIAIVMVICRVDMQWYWLILYAAVTIPFAPFVRDPTRFFR